MSTAAHVYLAHLGCPDYSIAHKAHRNAEAASAIVGRTSRYSKQGGSSSCDGGRRVVVAVVVGVVVAVAVAAAVALALGAAVAIIVALLVVTVVGIAAGRRGERGVVVISQLLAIAFKDW